MGEHCGDIAGGFRVLVRRGKPADYAALSRIAGDVFAPYGDYSEVLSSFLFIDDMVTLVAEAGGRVVGFLQLGIVPFGTKSLAVDVLAVGVDASYQGKGIGRRLFQAAFAEVDRRGRELPIRALLLTVAHTNDRAMALFESLGFRFTGESAGQYDGGQKALRMMRPCCSQGSVGKERGERTR